MKHFTLIFILTVFVFTSPLFAFGKKEISREDTENTFFNSPKGKGHLTDPKPTTKSIPQLTNLEQLENTEIELQAMYAPIINKAAGLTQGVSVIPKRGVPSEILVYGKNAFPFLVGSKGRCLMAYASYGKGSAIAMGNGSWLSNKATLKNKSIQKLLENSIALSKKKENRILFIFK